MKKTFEQIEDIQIILAERVAREKEAKVSTKLGEAAKLMIGNVNDRIRGKITYLAELLNEKRTKARRDNCSTDDKGNILRPEVTIKDGKTGNTQTTTGDGYSFTRENEEKCNAALKNIMKETVTLDLEKDTVMVEELPANLTDAEIFHLTGLMFTEQTLQAWKDKKAAPEPPQA